MKLLLLFLLLSLSSCLTKWVDNPAPDRSRYPSNPSDYKDLFSRWELKYCTRKYTDSVGTSIPSLTDSIAYLPLTIEFFRSYHLFDQRPWEFNPITGEFDEKPGVYDSPFGKFDAISGEFVTICNADYVGKKIIQPFLYQTVGTFKIPFISRIIYLGRETWDYERSNHEIIITGRPEYVMIEGSRYWRTLQLVFK